MTTPLSFSREYSRGMHECPTAEQAACYVRDWAFNSPHLLAKHWVTEFTCESVGSTVRVRFRMHGLEYGLRHSNRAWSKANAMWFTEHTQPIP